VDGIACCDMEVLVAPVALRRHLGGDTGLVLGYLAKADCLCCLTLHGDELLLEG
jgi:hypothetical protein